MQTYQKLSARILTSAIFLAGLLHAWAAPTIISITPANGATGVQPGNPVVFTFSTAMNTTATTVTIIDVTAGSISPTVVPVWSAGNTVLTYTPSPGFANNHEIEWTATGEDTLGNDLTGTTSGSFTTVPGVGGGSGDSPYTIFTVGRYSAYGQTTPSPGSFVTYEFFGQTYLASNRAASSVTLTIPVTGGISNLPENVLQPEIFSQAYYNLNQTTLSNKFPAGNYVFNVTATTSNQAATVTLPGLPWPNEPVVTNFTAAQSINSSKPFTLQWNTFTNGTSDDWILVQVQGTYGQTVFESPDYGAPNYLSGLSNSVAIPAGSLPPDSTCPATLIFYFGSLTTNGATIIDDFVGSVTEFDIVTTAGSGPPSLRIALSEPNVLLEWPTNSTGYTLEFANSLTGTWSTTLPSPEVVGSNNVVTTSLTGTQRYFRLTN